MIERLELKNFQSHGDLELQFGEGITTITGPTDRGKSAIVRAIGAALLNHVNAGHIKDGTDTTEISLVIDGATIRRVKGKSKNEYHLDDQEFKAFGKSVPTPIAKHANVDPDSVQRQFDAPFWVSLSGGALADELNRITGVEVLSKMSRESMSRLKSSKAEVLKATGAVESQRNALDQLAWVTDSLVAECERAELGRAMLGDVRGWIAETESTIAECVRVRKVGTTALSELEPLVEKANALLPNLNPETCKPLLEISEIEKAVEVIVSVRDKLKDRERKMNADIETLETSEITCPTVQPANDDRTIALCISDVHGSHSPPPAFGRDEWYPHMRTTLARLHGVWESHNRPIILMAGDLFHRWNEPVGLVSFIAETINDLFGTEDAKFYTITGQHDLPYHNINLVERSAYYGLHQMVPTMEAVGCEGVNHDTWGGGCFVFGYGWGADVDERGALSRLAAPAGACTIAMRHQFAYNGPDTGYVGVENHADAAFNQGLPGFDFTHYGDNHIRWKSKNVINPGTFMIRNRDDVGKVTGPMAITRSGLVLECPFDTTGDPVLNIPKASDNAPSAAPTATEVMDRLAAGVAVSDMDTMLRAYLRESLASESVKKSILELHEGTK